MGFYWYFFLVEDADKEIYGLPCILYLIARNQSTLAFREKLRVIRMRLFLGEFCRQLLRICPHPS